MRKPIIGVVLILLLTCFNAMATDYYVATNGNDSNSGTTTSSPFKNLQKAIDVVSAGDYIYIRGGVHSVSSTIVITKNGTSGSNIHVFAYSGESPILQFDNVENSSNKGVVMDGDYWHWKGITIEKAGDNGMLLSGNNNTIESCIFRKNCDTGLQLSRYSSSASSISDWPSNNLILNCEAYDNKDSDNEDADGFAAKLTCGTGNVFRGCVAHHNIDDGWDLYTKSETGPIGEVLFEDCIAHNNGILTDGATSGGGDKNGFKLGSSSNKVNHTLIRCIAFGNGKHGFTDNGNIGNIKFYNLTSYDNGDYNYHTRDNASHTFRNCITLNGTHTDRIVGDAPTSCNAFDDTDTDWIIAVSSSDFQTLSQGPDSDPTSNGFLNLKSSSSLIDAGCSAPGVTGNGTLDLGAIEYGGTPDKFTLTTSVSGSGSVNPSSGSYNAGENVTITATPSAGGTFVNWSGDASGSTNPLTVTMNSDKDIIAVFSGEPNQYLLSTNIIGQGTVSPASGSFDDGTNVNLTASPATGYSFGGWSGDASGSAETTSITMDSDKSVTATFISDNQDDIVHNFTESGTSSSFFNILGNLSTSKGTVTYNGLTLTQCLKIESSTSISFTSAQEGTLTLVFNNDFNGGFKIDGTNYSASSGILTLDLSTGNHTLTKGDVANLYYISLSYNNGACDPTQITSYIQLDGGSWNQTNSSSIDVGGAVVLGPHPTQGGSWNWSGPNGFSSNLRSVELSNIQKTQEGIYTAIFTNDCGATTSTNINLTVNEIQGGAIVLSATATDARVDLTWSSNNISSSYQVYRDLDNDPSGRVRIATTAELNYTDNDVTSGTTYYYWIKAIDINSATINSNVAEATPQGNEEVTITIQENETGFCGVDGTIDNNNSGFTAEGFANTENSLGNGIDWKINFGSSGTNTFVFRYASSSDRPADLIINGTTVASNINFPSTGSWTSWSTVSVTAYVSSGVNSVRLEASGTSGLANIDYIEVTGSGLAIANCNVEPEMFIVSTSVNGSGSISGAGQFEAGTSTRLEALPINGWEFVSWGGDISGTSNPIDVTINSNISVAANFREVDNPDVDFSMIGYAAVPGEGYSTTTGGQGGNEITINSLSALQSWAASRENNTTPEIVYIDGKISSSSKVIVTVKHGANISILGLGSTAELENVALNIRNTDNVIVRNLKIHEVLYPNDALTIDECMHVWVDHCEFHSIIGDGVTVDTYDGLLDIKKGSRYVTVSWCSFHDHMKVMLIGHTNNTGQQEQDSKMRVTLHHNHFYNTDGRNPSLRFGAIHMFNNYFDNIADYGIAARVGSHALIENCHYNDVKLSMSTDKFPVDGLPNGYICQSGNLFTGSTSSPVISQTGCDWWTSSTLPYSYTLDPVSTVASTVPANVGVGKISSLKNRNVPASVNMTDINNAAIETSIYPNPFNEYTNITVKLKEDMFITVYLYNSNGQRIQTIAKGSYSAGNNKIVFSNPGLKTGIYFFSIESKYGKETRQIIIE